MSTAPIPAWDGWRLGHDVKTPACVKICWGSRVQITGTRPGSRYREDHLFPGGTDPESLRPLAEAMYAQIATTTPPATEGGSDR